MEATEILWQRIRSLPDGHRLFNLKDRPEMIAIADDSGDTPNQTDDGVLWLDRHSPLAARQEACVIPVIDANGAKSSTPSDVQTLLILAAEYNWRIAGSYGVNYTITRER